MDHPANPYAATVAAGRSSFQWKSVGPGDLIHSRIDFGELFTRGWELFTRQLGMGVLLGLIFIGIGIASMIVSVPLAIARQYATGDAPLSIGVYVAELVFGIILGALMMCLSIHFGLKVARGNPAPLNKLFDIGEHYPKMLGLYVPLTLISLISRLGAGIPFGMLTTGDASVQTGALAALVLVGVPAIVLSTVLQLMFCLSAYLLVDRRMGVFESMNASMHFMRGNKLTVFLCMLVGMCVGFAAICCTLGIGFVFAIPCFSIWGAVIYLMATGQPIAVGMTAEATKPRDWAADAKYS
jgi:uncharacterized membrane protein